MTDWLNCFGASWKTKRLWKTANLLCFFPITSLNLKHHMPYQHQYLKHKWHFRQSQMLRCDLFILTIKQNFFIFLPHLCVISFGPQAVFDLISRLDFWVFNLTPAPCFQDSDLLPSLLVILPGSISSYLGSPRTLLWDL